MIWTMPSTTLSVSILNSTLTRNPLVSRIYFCSSAMMMAREGIYGVLRGSIQPSAWKGRSVNFAPRGFSDSSRAPGSVGRCARLVLRGEEKFTHPRDTPAHAWRLSLPQGRDVPDKEERGR